MTPEEAAALRAEFPASAIGQLPKPHSRDGAKGNCNVCGGYHGLPAAHLDYVGHAATTDRLLKVDPEWTWEPFAVDPAGLPALSKDGDLWIRLTVAGVTRIGVGDGKNMKERIGDAIRNAAMRFGVALDLWAKEDLHDNTQQAGDDPKPKARAKKAAAPNAARPPEDDMPPPPTEPASLTPQQKRTRRVMAMFGELGLSERPARLAKTSSIVGHDVASWSDLSDDEADQVDAALRMELGR